MANFESVDPKQPATLESVVRAVAKLSQLSEAQLAEMVAAGPLASFFPFQPQETAVPDDFANDDDVPEASAMPLDDERYSKLVQSSMPPARSATRIEAAALALGVRESDLVQALQVIEAKNAG